MLIRKAETKDYDLWVRLNSEVQGLHAKGEPAIFKQTISVAKEYFEDLISDPAFSVLIGEADGCPVGYIFLEVKHRKETPYTFALSVVYVHHVVVI